MSRWFGMLKSTWRDFSEDSCTRLASSLSYATIFAIPPLLGLVLLLAGAVADPAKVQQVVLTQTGGLVGPQGAQQIHDILLHAKHPSVGAGPAAIIGIAALVLGAVGAFVELQSDMNIVWEVAPDPEAGGIKNMILPRLLSFGMVVAIAFLLLVSLVISALLAAFGGFIGHLVPGVVSGALLEVINNGISLAVITLLFAAIYKVLPDAEVAWRDVWVGALFTAILFVVGKFLIGLYLGHSDPGSSFGAAGAVILLLAWVYYSAIILFFGAEFTQQWACAHGRDILPSAGAVRVVTERRHLEPGEPAGDAGKSESPAPAASAGRSNPPSPERNRAPAAAGGGHGSAASGAPTRVAAAGSASRQASARVVPFPAPPSRPGDGRTRPSRPSAARALRPARAGEAAAEEKVRSRPLASVAAAAVVGFVMGRVIR